MGSPRAVASVLEGTVPVLLRVGSGEGERRCDAVCYDAKKPRCTCKVCGGLMHGLGWDGAVKMLDKLTSNIPSEERVGSLIDRRRHFTRGLLLRRELQQRLVDSLTPRRAFRHQVQNGQLELPMMAYVAAGAPYVPPLLEEPVPPLRLARPKRRP